MKDETKNRSNGSKYTLLFSQALTRVSVILLAALLCFPLDSSGNDNLRWSRTKPTVKASTTKMLVLGDTGPQTAGDADDNDCGSGSGWASEASAEGGDDGNRAEVDLSDNEISDCLDLSSFGLSVPGGATILGIEVSIDRQKETGTKVITDHTIQLLDNGTPVGSNKATATDWPANVDGVATYGGAADTWAAGLTASDMANLGLRIRAQANSADGDREARVDYVEITVYYDDNSGGGGGATPTDLEVVSITHVNGPIVPGTTETFEIEVRNNGPADAVGTILSFDIVDANWFHINAFGDPDWTFLLSGTAARLTPMPSGATETLTIEAHIPANATYEDDIFLSIGPVWAAISHSGTDLAPGNNEIDIIPDTRIEAALSIEKQLLTPNAAPGGTALYEIEVCNNGPSDVAGVGVTDIPGANLVGGSVILSPGADNLYIPANQCRSVFATATVDPAAVVGSNFSNTAAIDLSNIYSGGVTLPHDVTAGPNSTDGTGEVIGGAAALAPADVEIVSLTLLGGGPVVPGTNATFRVDLRNNGPVDAYGAVVTMLVTDLDFIVNNILWTPNAWAPLSSGGTWLNTQPWPAGSSSFFEVTLAIPSDAHYQAYDILGALSVVIAAANPDPVPANNWGSLSFDTQAQASLSIEKTLFTLGVSPGGTALYEVTICNTGPSDIDGIALVDVPGLNLVPGSLVISADADDLYIGAGRCVEVLVSARVALGAPVGGNFCNSAAVDDANALAGLGSTLPPVVNEPSTGNVCGNVVPSLPPADVQVLSLTHDTSPMIPGTTESFTFIVTNNGPSPAYGATILVDLADVNWVVDSYSFPSTWSYMGDGVFARLNPMPPGAVETFTLELGIPSDAIVNLAAFDELGPVVVSIASSSPDPNTANNTMLEILDSENHADLSITKDIVNTEVGPGETAIFNIVVNNAGPSDVDGVGFMDDLSPNASIFYFEPFNIDNFYVAAGQSKSFLVTAQVNEDGCGTVENCAWVSGPDYNIDGNPDNNGPSCASFDIYDDVDPVAAVCPPATIEVDNDPGICGAFIECYVEFTDNCDDFLDLELIKGLPCECEGGGEGEEEEEDVICGNIFPVGMTQVIWKATDDNGNMAFCEFMVMVSDTEQPTIECPDDIVVELPSGDAIVVAGQATIFSQGPCGVTLTYPPPFGDDNCGDFLITHTSGLGAEDNCTGADFEGCFAIGNWDISADGDGYVDTGNAPDDVTLVSTDDGTNNAETRMCITIPSDGVLSFDWNYESDDDAPNYDPFGYEVNGVFFQLSDDLGANIQSGSVSIPVEAGDEFCFVQASTDGCCGAAATISSFFAFIDDNPPSPEYYEYGGTYTETYMITDASGNSEECSFSITVEDTNFPNIHCPNNFVVYTDDANCGAQVMYAYPLGLDNCPGWYVTTIYGPLPGQNFSLGNTVVEYIITDANGNSVTCDFKVRVVDGEAPTFFECAPDQEVETSNNGIDDCCAEVPRLKGDAVVGDNCQETGDLPLVALFYDEDYTDTQENCDGEAWNVRQHLENRGFDIVFIDRLEDYPTWSNALNQSSLLVIPALTGNGDFLTDIPNSVKSLLYSFVSTNGAKLLIMDGGEGPNNNAANILNEVYGYSLTDDCCYNGNLSYLNLENSLYTGFQHGPVAIEQYFQTKIISNLVWPAIPIYELALNGQVEDGWASVARLPKGDGDIIYFGWSFRHGGPLCANADTEFTEVLDRALLHLAGQGIIITQSPEAYSTICGEHGEEFEVITSAIDAAGNESSCTTILTLIDDEFPDLFLPDTLVLDCDDISETQDPSAQILDWLASAYAIDNCDEEPYLTYDFDETTLDICIGDTLSVTWTAVDEAGNITIDSSAIIVVPDTQDPELFVPAPIELDCSDISETSDPAAIIAAWLAEAYTNDNCDTDPELAHSFNGDLLDVCADEDYVITVTWTANDACGNTTVLSSTITVVVDDVDPFLFVPAPIELDCSDISETSDPAAIIDAWLAEAYTNDNCDTDPELAHSFNGDLLDVCADEDYVITVTWTANDACGNTTVLSSTITVVVDDVDPFLFVPAPIELDCSDISETSDPAAIIDAWLAEAYTNDNCDTDPELAHSFNGDLLDVCADEDYVITVTWTANDACGNTTVLSSTITVVVDDVDPFLFVPAPIELDCSDISETADPAAIIDAWLAEAYTNDNCDTDPELAHSFNGDLLDVCADEDYVITVTWTANDACGNTTVLSSTITVVVDDVDPFLFVPAPIELDCSDISETSDPAAIIDAWLAEAYTNDNCDTDPELAHSFNGDLLDVCADEDYVITVTWTANDACGNTTVLSSTITVVVDDVDPFLFVPAPIELDCSDISETSDPAAIIDAWLAEAYTNDNCDTDPELAHSFNGDLLDVCADEDYVITVTWTANDACGNTTVLSSTITVVVDDVDPFLFVPAPIELDCSDISETSDPAAIIDAWLAEAYTNDNCDTDPELAHSFNGDLLDVCADEDYVITVTWTANDACGNETILSSTITVLVDDVDPDLFVPDPITLDCGDISETADPAAIIDAWLAEAYTTDNCDTDPELAHSFNGDLLDICAAADYVITVTWTANDACGNETILSSTITVLVDDVDPDLFVPDPITLDCGDISETADPAAIIDAWLAEAYTTDNCDTDPELAHSFNGDLLDICAAADYVITVTWTANDACGNTTELSSTITVVVDDVDPVITLPAAPLVLDCDDISETTDPSATILDWLASATASDNCDTDPELTYDFDITDLDVCIGGTLTVTWTAVDACGNTSTASSTITVIPDTDAPVFVECPVGYTFNNDVDKCGANVTWAVPVAEDACTADVVVVQTDGPAQGSFLEVGIIYTVEYTATDGCGNTATCTFTLEVVDMQNPVAICQDVVVYLDEFGNASITPADVDGGSYDNCAIEDLSIDISSFTCANVGENNVILTVTDPSGNSEQCVAEVTVVDNLAPIFTCPDPAIVSGCDDLIPDLLVLVTDATDNCGVADMYQNPVAGTDFGNMSGQTVIVTIFVWDVNGNVATCEVPVTIDDTVPPVFTNCPTEMHMIGNDPDQCSGKLNWSIPVATDNCELESITQISGPVVGSIIPVCQPMTIVYEAEDAVGNTTLCSFQVMVVDTQKPEFDADILMPGDITVECDAVPAPFVLTNNDVHDNCTAPEDLMITFTEVSTQDPNPLVCAHYNYTITRTWTVMDETCPFPAPMGSGGNKLVHVQIITVQDTTPPTAICQNITITLNKAGTWTIPQDTLNNGSFDNCAPAFALSYSTFPSTFTCANLGPNVVTLTVTDPCGNSSTCTGIVTVVEGIAPCTPEFSVVTECLDNATTNNNDGQFYEVITVKSLAMQTWTVMSSTGLYTNGSPAPPAAPIAVASGTALTAGTADGIDNDGDGATDEADEMIYYTLKAKFVECVGYNAMLKNNLNQTGTISNNACYPTPVFVDLFDPFCLSTPPFPIQVADFFGADGEIVEVFIDGEEIDPPYLFDALDLGEGPHLVKVTFTAYDDFESYTIINGVVVSGSPNGIKLNSGCEQMISTFVNVVETPVTVACNDTIQVSLEGDCISEVTPDMILEGSYFCYDDYTVTITYPLGTTQFVPANQVNASHIGKVLVVNLSHLISGNMCWSHIVVEDKWKPEITCPDDIEILCVYDEDDLLITGNPIVFDCSDYVLEYSDEYIQFDCAENSSVFTHITRTFIVTDIYGNNNSCVQHIDQLRGEISQVNWPDDITYQCNNVPGNFLPGVTGWPQIGNVNLTTTGTGICGLSVSYTDQIANICPGEYKIVRTWTIFDWCTEGTGGPSNQTFVQYIKIADVPPTISYTSQSWVYDAVNDWYIISANNWVSEPHPSCYALGPLPLAIIDGVCNELVSVEISTPVGTTTNGGLLPWPGLEIGQHQITYVAQDECGNITSSTITVNVIDNVVPTTICDEITDVNLSGDGFAIVNATTFNDGSYDNCCLDYFAARRMDGDCYGEFDDFGPTVEFCCVDAGTAVMVVFRAYDCYGNYNDCMVTVNVNDKLPPILISCPATATITCDDYLQNYAAGLADGDFSVLDGFGSPTFYDNCQLDVTHTVTVNIDNCSKGTLTRTWTATDGSNVPVTCTQTIFVNHVSDWVVEFPAHVTVQCTDGQLPDTGEPEIFHDECELIAVSWEDQLFEVVPDACYKIERTWTVINWCVYEQFGEDLYSENGHAESNLNADWDGDGDKDNRTFRDGYNSSGNPGTADGYIVWKQIIKVEDNEDPTFEIPEIDGCIVETDCDKDLILPYPVILDECSPEFDVDISGDFGIFNDISGDVTVPNVGVGEYEVNYAVTDHCGNSSYQTITVIVEDCKLPTPYCKNGLIIEIMQTQMIEVWATDLDAGSFDNCGDVILSFSPDVNDINVIYTCDDLGQNAVQLWVTDIYGNQDYCETFIVVQDNLNFCSGVPVVIAGEVSTEDAEAVEGVTVEMNGGLLTEVTGLDGQYDFSVIAGSDYTVTPMLDEDADNGVTTFDMVLITRHILNVQLLDSPYKVIAADANNSDNVSTLDLVAIRKVILQVEDNFPNNTSWRFVDEDYLFPNPVNPWADPNGFPEVISYNNLQASELEADFVAIKVGDVNGSAAVNATELEDRTMMGDLLFHTRDLELKAGKTYEVPFFGDNQEVSGYQFTLELGEGLELVQVLDGVAREENFGFALLENGALTTSWNEADVRRMDSEEALFTLVFKARENTTLSKELSVSSRYTKAEAYNANGELLNVQLAFGNELAAGFELYQNVPNPFTGETRIGFRLPESSTATLTVLDASGKVLKVLKGEYARGYNEMNLSDFAGVSGVLYYQLDTPTHTATRKMVIME